MKKINNKIFAEAVVAVGREAGVDDRIASGLKDVAATLFNNLELKNFLNEPRVAFSAKEEALTKVFADKVDKRVYHIIFLLIKEKSLSHLDDLLLEINRIKNEQDGIIEVKAVSSSPISDQTQQRIIRILGGKMNKEIKVMNIIDQNIIGGLMIKIGDTVIDGSIKGKINRLKNRIIKIT